MGGVPVLDSLMDFVEFTAGITFVHPRRIVKLLRKALKSSEPVTVNNGYAIIFDKENGRLILLRNGEPIAMYVHTRGG